MPFATVSQRSCQVFFCFYFFNSALFGWALDRDKEERIPFSAYFDPTTTNLSDLLVAVPDWYPALYVIICWIVIYCHLASHDKHCVKLFISNEQQTPLRVISIPLAATSNLVRLVFIHRIIRHPLLSPIYSLFFHPPTHPIINHSLLLEMSGIEEILWG